ncbi:MAG TPA: glutamate--cysteine ligase [Pseudonocardiaceae bacterium]
MAVPTLGVEEEFLTVDPLTREPVPAGAGIPDTVHDADLDFQLELSPAQVETATGVCADLRGLREQLARGRRRLADAAVAAGARLLATGVPPLGDPPARTSDTPRYREMGRRYGALTTRTGLCGCHVHVAVPIGTAVQVSNFLRPWLPALTTVTANSPFFDGAETGYASWRSLLWSRWPLAGPPPYFESERHYRQLVAELIRGGVIMDQGMIYWFVRPSAHAPTVEVRIADVATTVDDAVLLAGLVRGLVTLALRDLEAGRPAPTVGSELLRAACWQAARGGLAGRCVDPISGDPSSGWAMLDRLHAHVRPALVDHGDDGILDTLLGRLRSRGCGADLQRADHRRTGDVRAVVDAAIGRTTS